MNANDISLTQVDTLGLLLAQIAELTAKADAIKDSIKDAATAGGAKVVEASQLIDDSRASPPCGRSWSMGIPALRVVSLRADSVLLLALQPRRGGKDARGPRRGLARCGIQCRATRVPARSRSARRTLR